MNLRIHRQRDVHIGRVAYPQAEEWTLRHSDDCERCGADFDGAADHVRIASKPALPVSVAQDSPWVCTRRAVVGRDQAANRGTNT